MKHDNGWVLIVVLGFVFGLLWGHMLTIASTQKDCRLMGASRIGGMTISCQVEDVQ